MTPTTMRRVLQRVVLPADRDTDVLPLYVDPDRPQLDVNTVGMTLKQRSRLPPAPPNADMEPDPHAVLDRRRYRIGESSRISFGTYFNAFAASYWRQWTVVSEVSLHVRIRGEGASVIIYRSMPDGRSQRVDDETVHGTEPVDLRFDLSLASFADAG
jgi:galactofuranosylgalactofuranosylrhamnosyl-N-acetylglucosaminyl-diphospho-decaprenol beta-1,5/1,6-galactofuranosyltransferase